MAENTQPQAGPEISLYSEEIKIGAITAPDFIHLALPEGFVARDGRGPHSYDFEELKAAFDSGNKRLPIDIEHLSLKPGQNYDPKAYGWIVGLVQDPEKGIYAQVEWTDEGRELIESGAMRYISPVFGMHKVIPFRITQIVGAALTNYPNLKVDGMYNQNITLETAEDAAKQADTQPVEAHNEPITLESTPAAVDEAAQADAAAVDAIVEKAADENAEVLAAFSVIQAALQAEGEALTPAEVSARTVGLINAHSEQSRAIEAHSQQLSVSTFASEQLKAEAEAHRQRADALEVQLQAYNTQQREKAATEAVDQAIAAFKVTAANREAMLRVATADLAAFNQLVSNMPSLVQDTPFQNVATQANDNVLSQAHSELCKLMGWNEATFAKNLTK